MFKDNRSKEFEQGHLAIPLSKEKNHFRVFFVCAGLEEDNTMPSWTCEKVAADLLGVVTPSIYPETKGAETIDFHPKSFDSAYVVCGQNICKGDFIKARGQF